MTKSSVQAANRKLAIAVGQPALARTCQILREEGLPRFYRENTFDDIDLKRNLAWTQLQWWLDAIRKHNRALLRAFSLRSVRQEEAAQRHFAGTWNAEIAVRLEVKLVGTVTEEPGSDFTGWFESEGDEMREVHVFEVGFCEY
jgi:hypothetical protein